MDKLVIDLYSLCRTSKRSPAGQQHPIYLVQSPTWCSKKATWRFIWFIRKKRQNIWSQIASLSSWSLHRQSTCTYHANKSTCVCACTHVSTCNFDPRTEYNVTPAVSITGAHLARYLPNMRPLLSLIAHIGNFIGSRSEERLEQMAVGIVHKGVMTSWTDWITLHLQAQAQI